MWAPVALLIAGWAVIGASVIAAGVMALRRDQAADDQAASTLAWLQELRAGRPQPRPALAAQLERLPFQDELDDPQRARGWAELEWADLLGWARRAGVPV